MDVQNSLWPNSRETDNLILPSSCITFVKRGAKPRKPDEHPEASGREASIRTRGLEKAEPDSTASAAGNKPKPESGTQTQCTDDQGYRGPAKGVRP